MAIFELEFELSGLKVKIKSDREDAPSALNAVQQQIGGLLQTAAGLGTSDISPSHQPIQSLPSKVIEAPTRTSELETSRSKARRSKRSHSAVAIPAVNYSHDQHLGQPKQAWTTARKAMWMLSILEQQTAKKDYSTAELVATFNKNFKEFGPITTTNVTRDLGKVRPKGFVTSDASKDPQTWYLLDAGKREISRFLAEVEGHKS